MSNPIAISIVLSTSGSRLGGAAIAAEFHSQYINKSFPMELWRMWDKNEELYHDNLKIKNFVGKTKLDFLNTFLPKKIKFLILDSDYQMSRLLGVATDYCRVVVAKRQFRS